MDDSTWLELLMLGLCPLAAIVVVGCVLAFVLRILLEMFGGGTNDDAPPPPPGGKPILTDPVPTTQVKRSAVIYGADGPDDIQGVDLADYDADDPTEMKDMPGQSYQRFDDD